MPVRINSIDDGISLSVASPPTSTSYTIAGFMYLVNARNGNDRDFINVATAGFSTIHKLYQASDNTTRIVDAAATSTSLGGVPNVGEWCFFALTNAGTGATDLKGYLWRAADVDGSPLTASVTSNGGTIGLIYVGSNQFNSWFDAEFCFIKAWTAVLTQTELAAERHQGYPVKTSSIYCANRCISTSDTTDASGNARTCSYGGTTANGVQAEPVPWLKTGGILLTGAG